MIAPEIIERIKKEKDERDRPKAQLPLNVPEIRNPEEHIEQEEKTDRVVIIDMA